MISILDQNFTALNQYLEKQKPSQIFILVDENTHNHCLPVLLANLETEIPFEIIEIEAGEENKNINTATQLWEILSEFEADRKSLMINLGGGEIPKHSYHASLYVRCFYWR
jgi:3-dehydroquinate synthase